MIIASMDKMCMIFVIIAFAGYDPGRLALKLKRRTRLLIANPVIEILRRGLKFIGE